MSFEPQFDASRGTLSRNRANNLKSSFTRNVFSVTQSRELKACRICDFRFWLLGAMTSRAPVESAFHNFLRHRFTDISSRVLTADLFFPRDRFAVTVGHVRVSFTEKLLLRCRKKLSPLGAHEWNKTVFSWWGHVGRIHNCFRSGIVRFLLEKRSPLCLVTRRVHIVSQRPDKTSRKALRLFCASKEADSRR